MTDKFIEKAKHVHGDKYDYSKTVYEHNLKEVIIICKKCGEFEQVPKSHLKGMGCSRCCNSKGYSLNSIHYLIK